MEMTTIIVGMTAFFFFGLIMAWWWRTGPATAFFSAGGFLGAVMLYGVTPQAIALGLAGALSVLLCEIDRRHLILPDLLVAPLILLALATAPLAPLYPGQTLAGAAAGGGFAALLLYAVRWGYGRWRHREGLGLGDVKLAVAGGALAGPTGVAPMIFLAAMTTLAVALVLRLAGDKSLGDRKLPFGPGLCVGMILVVIGRYEEILR